MTAGTLDTSFSPLRLDSGHTRWPNIVATSTLAETMAAVETLIQRFETAAARASFNQAAAEMDGCQRFYATRPNLATVLACSGWLAAAAVCGAVSNASMPNYYYRHDPTAWIAPAIFAIGMIAAGVRSVFVPEAIEQISDTAHAARLVSQDHVEPLHTLLASLTDDERALLAPYVTRTLALKKRSGEFTVAVTADLAGAAATQAQLPPSTLRVVRAAVFTHALREHPDSWAELRKDLLQILGSCEISERRALTAELLRQLFKADRCTANVGPAEANELYRLLSA